MPAWAPAEDLVLLTYSLEKCVIPYEYECFTERVSNGKCPFHDGKPILIPPIRSLREPAHSQRRGGTFH